MFQTLDEQIERTEGGRSLVREHLVRFGSLAAISVILFGGLLFLVVALE